MLHAMIILPCSYHIHCYLQEDGWTAMFYVATEGNVDITRKLLERGADPNIQDSVN